MGYISVEGAAHVLWVEVARVRQMRINARNGLRCMCAVDIVWGVRVLERRVDCFGKEYF